MRGVPLNPKPLSLNLPWGGGGGGLVKANLYILLPVSLPTVPFSSTLRVLEGPVFESKTRIQNPEPYKHLSLSHSFFSLLYPSTSEGLGQCPMQGSSSSSSPCRALSLPLSLSLSLIYVYIYPYTSLCICILLCYIKLDYIIFYSVILHIHLCLYVYIHISKYINPFKGTPSSVNEQSFWLIGRMRTATQTWHSICFCWFAYNVRRLVCFITVASSNLLLLF